MVTAVSFAPVLLSYEKEGGMNPAVQGTLPEMHTHAAAFKW